MSKIYVDEILPKDNAKITAADLQLPAGSIIQVVTFDYTGGEQSITSTSDVATYFTLNITPKFANSKIFITTAFNLRKNTGTTNDGANISLYRNGTKIRDKWAFAWGFHLVSSSGMFGSWSGHYTDTPNTTSQLTYTVYAASFAGGDMRIGDTSSGGSLVAMEIAQ